MDLLVYVSGHGYGHATRTRAWLTALRARPEGARLAVRVRSEAPAEALGVDALGAALSPAPIDPGLLQRNALDVDLAASRDAHAAFLRGFDAAAAREADLLRGLGARLVVADVPPLAFAAAARAGLPSLAVANFGWDWILEGYADFDPVFAEAARTYRAAYAHADELLRLPFHGADDFAGFARVRDVPLLVNRSTRSRADCRRALGVEPDDARRLVLVSFGGLGGVEAPVPAGLGGDYRFVTGVAGLPLPHQDVVHACDALIGKPGYSTVAEAVAHGTRFVYLPRDGFREVGPLLDGLARHGRARPLARDDFRAGRWREALDAVFADPPPERPPCGGAEAVADAVLARLA